MADGDFQIEHSWLLELKDLPLIRARNPDIHLHLPLYNDDLFL